MNRTPGVLAQAEDRCHRIGQQNAVNVMYLICEGKLSVVHIISVFKSIIPSSHFSRTVTCQRHRYKFEC